MNLNLLSPRNKNEQLSSIFNELPISPILEMGAYEYLWSQTGITFKRLSDIFKENPNSLPSDFVEEDIARETADKVLDIFKESGIMNFGLRIFGTNQYPQQLRDAINPIELLYFLGTWELADAKSSVAIVGSRKASEEGMRRARKLAAHLAKNDITVVSGLAEGIDTGTYRSIISWR